VSILKVREALNASLELTLSPISAACIAESLPEEEEDEEDEDSTYQSPGEIARHNRRLIAERNRLRAESPHSKATVVVEWSDLTSSPVRPVRGALFETDSKTVRLKKDKEVVYFDRTTENLAGFHSTLLLGALHFLAEQCKAQFIKYCAECGTLFDMLLA
jgi:hypothetical protein